MIQSAIRQLMAALHAPRLAVAVGCLGLALLGVAARADEPRPGIAMLGQPALPANFDHLPYANPDAPKGGRLTIGAQGTFDSLNPFNIKAGSTAQGLAGNVFQTLMMRNLDEPFTLYGLIAQSIETTPDRSRVTLRLNPLARFSDGSPITSDDVRFTFELLKAKGRPQFRGAYGQVKALLTPDAHTVVYDLTGVGDRELPLILVLMPVLSKAHTDVEHFNDATLTPPVASGPYVVEKVEPGQRLTLRRDPNYWGKDLPVSRGLYNFDEIRVEYYRDANAMHEAFKAGLLDYREETNPTRWMNGYDFPAIHDGRVIKASLPLGGPKGMQGFAFNTRRAIFADPCARRLATCSTSNGSTPTFLAVSIGARAVSSTSPIWARQASRRTRASAPCSRACPAPRATTFWRVAGRRPRATAADATATWRATRSRCWRKPATACATA